MITVVKTAANHHFTHKIISDQRKIQEGTFASQIP